LIIDPKTSHVLADETTIGRGSAPTIDTLILEVGWTDGKPHTPMLPAALPRAGAGLNA